jgi:hypothetical protein
MNANSASLGLAQSPLTRKRGGLLWIATDEVEQSAYRPLRVAAHTKLPPIKQLVNLSLPDEAYAHGIAC